ncbi:MAG: DUF3379 domain-containing protein [Pseudomonadota bacterium]|nr:DUF3379 domain-containing protein [Pseudomonadota bacterium]
MNCLDFRREALAQPLRLADAAQQHADECPGCLAFLERQRSLDADLFDAMRVPAPDGLADRILVAQGIRRRGRPWGWALAATLVLAAGIAWLTQPTFSGRALAGEAIAHVIEEPQSFTATRPVSDDLASDLAAQGIKVAKALGHVTYVQLCPMGEARARHFVVATEAGPVTLLLIPADTTRRARALMHANGLAAIALPAARGSIAIVAATPEQALTVERSLSFS